MTETGEQDIDANNEGQNDEYYGFLPFTWNRREVSSSEITTIEIRWDRSDGEYFFGEDATIMATYGNHSAVHRINWMRKRDSENHAVFINIKLQKYTGSTCSNMVEKPMLLIKNCDESDIGTYHLLVMCNNDLPIYSNKIDLKVVKGRPIVTLNPVPLALQNELVQIKATIRGFPKCQRVIWMKDNEYIDTTAPKHEGSIDSYEFPVLCIKEVNEGDDGVYTVIACNELGEGENKEDLEVIGKNKMIFISGPVVVTPSKTITFDAYLPGRGIFNAKWWKIKDQSKKLLEVDDKKYCIYQMKDKIRFEITLADKDDSAAYQLSWKTKKSNRINVHIDDSGMFSTSKQGNCLRFFELQSVSAAVMRTVLDKMPGSFQGKIKQYRESCLKSEKKKDFILRLKQRKIDSSEKMDISLMYLLIRVLWSEKAPTNDWGEIPGENDIERADDIERIRCYRNSICHSDASEMDINTFNFSCLDLFRAIERLSSYDPKLIQSTCDIMNKVCTKGKDLQKMIEKLQNEKELNQAPINEDPCSPLSSQDEDRDEDPMPRTSPAPANKETNGRAETTERPMQYPERRVSDSSDSETNGRAETTERPMQYPERRVSDSSDSEFGWNIYFDPKHFNREDENMPFLEEKSTGSPSQHSLSSEHSQDSESLHDIRIPTIGVCDPDIKMLDNFTRATQMQLYGDGICFMNRPMKLYEKIHIHGYLIPISYVLSYSISHLKDTRAKIKIGLTNTDPEKIRETVRQKKSYTRNLVEINCFSDDDRGTDFFHICICLCPSATLSISVNGSKPHFYKCQEISSLYLIWLVIELYGIRSIKISNN